MPIGLRVQRNRHGGPGSRAEWGRWSVWRA